MAKLCMGCMKIKESGHRCEHCGFDERSNNGTHQLPVGTIVGRQYTLGRVLGQGGFGITYIGWDNIDQQRVAVKEYFPTGYAGRDSRSLMVTSYDGPGSKDFENNKSRFLREAEALAQLRHIPQIVRVLRYFEENRTAYIAMEYIEGQDLRRHLKNLGRPMTVEETLSVLGPVMEAMEQVHRVKLVHRDISPDNIMLLPDGSTKLLDFGAARYVQNANAYQNRDTSTQAILKHGFAPPEQYSSHGALGPWTDVYAMCATVYYCLTGRVPPEAMIRSVEGTAMNWDSIPGLTKQQKAALEKGMSLQPGKRFASMEELWQQLKPREARPEPRIRKKPLLITAAAAAAVLAAAVGIGLLSNSGEEPPQETQQIRVPEATPATTEEAILPTETGEISIPSGLEPGTATADVKFTYEENETGITITGCENTPNNLIPAETTPDEPMPALEDGWWDKDSLPANLVIPRVIDGKSVTAIGRQAFSNCDNLVSVILPDTLISIEGSAFYYCRNLVRVNIPAGVSLIENRAFSGTPWLDAHTEEYVIVGDGVLLKYNGSDAYVKLPSSVKMISDAFDSNGSIKKVNIPNSVTMIGPEAFYGCKNLTDVSIPESVHTIGHWAFRDCVQLRSIIIPHGVTRIGPYTFSACLALTNVSIPDSVEYIDTCAFEGVPWLTKQTEEFIVVGDGVLLKYNGTDSIVQVPSNVKMISDAFAGNEKITQVIIPSGVTDIAIRAFLNCRNLTNVTVPESVLFIGREAFDNTALDAVTISEKCTLGPNAFERSCKVAYY